MTIDCNRCLLLTSVAADPSSSHPFLLTELTVDAQVSGAGAVTNVTVPPLLAEPPIATGCAAAPLLQFSRAEAANAERALDLGQAANVPTFSVDEEVADTAHVAVVQQRRPHLWRQDESRLGLGQTSQVHVTVQVQDLTALRGAEGHAAAVD